MNEQELHHVFGRAVWILGGHLADVPGLVVESYAFYKSDAMYAHGPLGGPTPLTAETIGLFVCDPFVTHL